MRHLLARPALSRAAMGPSDLAPENLGDGPAAIAAVQLRRRRASTPISSAGHNRRPSAPSAPVGTEGEHHDVVDDAVERRPIRIQKRKQIDGGGAGLPIRARQAVGWLMLAGGNLVRQFLVAQSQARHSA